MPVDDIFRDRKEAEVDFEFNAQVASVFDDMVVRSVPLYGEIQKFVGMFLRPYLEVESNIYDVGCSTGNTIRSLLDNLPAGSKTKIYAVEPSQAMLQQAQEKIKDHTHFGSVVWVCKTVEELLPINDAAQRVCMKEFSQFRVLVCDEGHSFG